MKKHKKKLIALAVFAVLSIAAIPFSPQVEYGLSKMLNLNGEFTRLIFEGGQEFTAEDISSGAVETDPLALKITNNLSDIDNAATARSNLGAAGTSSVATKLDTAGGTITGNLAVSGTSTTSGNRVYGTNTVTIIYGGHVYSFPASGTQTITNADIYALAGLGAEGNILVLLDNMVAAVGGSSTGQSLTNANLLGVTTFSGEGFTWAAGSSTNRSFGTYTAGTTQGSNANVLLDPDGTGQVLTGITIGTVTPVYIVQKQLGTQTFTGTTTETTVWQYSVPANALSTNGILEVQMTGSCTTGSGSKILRLYYGGSLIGRATVPSINTYFRYAMGMVAKGSTTAQFSLIPQYNNAYGVGTTPPLEINVNSTQAQNLYLTYESVSGTESCFFNIVNLFKY